MGLLLIVVGLTYWLRAGGKHNTKVMPQTVSPVFLAGIARGGFPSPTS
jgi:hypothetical protein